MRCDNMFVFCFIPLLSPLLAMKYEGDLCSIGVCRKARDCPQAFKDRTRDPDLCMFTRNGVIICCPEEQPTPVVPLLESTEFARVSTIKCQQYQREMEQHQKSLAAALVPDPIFFEVTNNNAKCDPVVPLIVNGMKTNYGEFPHMAAIGFDTRDEDESKRIRFICGGVLISRTFVLTAAHCTNVFGDQPTVVRLGSTRIDFMAKEAYQEDIPIAEVIPHPNYKRTLYYHDIGLVRLVTEIQFNDYIRPACLWTNNEMNPTNALATGWGAVKFGGKKSDHLLKVPLSIYEEHECRKLYGRHKRIPKGILSSQICAGSRAGDKDTCSGDSGGPIQVVSDSCIYHVLGITSFGKSCAMSNTPGVYTRVASYLDWIESVVWSNEI